jgi:hypothetical protein
MTLQKTGCNQNDDQIDSSEDDTIFIKVKKGFLIRKKKLISVHGTF